jgi:hypothetical protein
MKLIICLLLNILLIGVVNAEQATSDSSCLNKINKSVEIGDEINITLNDNKQHVGRLISTDKLNNQFKIGFITREGIQELDLQINQLDYLTYRKYKKIRPGMLLGGIVVGGVIGHILEYSIIDPHTEKKSPFDEMTHRGSFWGIVGGAVLGSIISLSTPTKMKITCNF